MELYVHIPFCKKKCRYCSFTSFAGQESRYEEYVDLLLKEAESRLSEADEPVRTVYFGGGTPSLLSPALFYRLAHGLGEIYGLKQVDECTSEANPGTVTPEWLEAAVSAGISRISFGMQAFQDSLLSLLGRIHTFEDVRRSVCLSREAGIGNISLDLMFGIPSQSACDWEETICHALSLDPCHISAYGLIPEEGTPLCCDLENGTLHLPDPDQEREMYDTAIQRLKQAGLLQYEISNFAKPGYECRHNIGYWTQVPYIGLGVAAASMSVVKKGPDGMSCVRRTNPDTMKQYRKMVLSGGLSASEEKISPPEARFETMMLGLRMNSGVSERNFLDMHGISLERCYGSRLRSMESRGLTVHENGSWRLTRRGFDIQNSILVELMDDPVSSAR